MSEVIIIGAGPAGISAALYTARAGINTTIIYKDTGALKKADKIENYYGFSSPIGGGELFENGISQAQRVGVKLIRDEVVYIGIDNGFLVSGANGQYTADSVIIATGSPRSTPKTEGIEKYDGRGISYCAVCDAFFYRNKDVAVIGCCDYALHETAELLPVVKSVTLLTNGIKASVKFPSEVNIIDKKIKSFGGDERLRFVEFEDGARLDTEGAFIAYGTAGSAELARKIGATVEGKKIVANENMETSIPGLFAAGDCTGGMLQIAAAVCEGATAGTSVVKYIRNKRG